MNCTINKTITRFFFVLVGFPSGLDKLLLKYSFSEKGTDGNFILNLLLNVFL